MFSMKTPFSGLHGEVNGATYMIMQRQENCDLIVNKLIALARAGENINDGDLQESLFVRYGLSDATEAELKYIKTKVEEKLR